MPTIIELLEFLVLETYVEAVVNTITELLELLVLKIYDEADTGAEI